ncbi:MAG: 1-deoxy-D-xylulose-5-phosphate reductoisomerase [Acidobacteriota bacterium]
MNEMPSKGIAILGSTGSIGRQTLDLIGSLDGRFRVISLSGGKNWELLSRQIVQFRPRVAAIGDPRLTDRLRDACTTAGTRLVSGSEGLQEVAVHPEAELLLSGIVGAAGLEPTYAALEAGKTVALANKEALVMAGGLMMEKARERGVEIIPVDSEHCALHQCMRGEKRAEVRRLILTASGGPFFSYPASEMTRITPEMALRHPTWKMGRKITIDSATMMNKGLEVIEARWLFGIEESRIDIVVHPQSMIHSLVEFVDGSLISQMGATDMRFPLQYALSFPDRLPTPLERLPLEDLPSLEFRRLDPVAFPSPGLARQAVRTGGTAPAALNAANEIAVDGFLNRKISFPAIPRIVEEVLERHVVRSVEKLEDVLEADRAAREEARRAIENGVNSC